jgi:hypothetical protein
LRAGREISNAPIVMSQGLSLPIITANPTVSFDVDYQLSTSDQVKRQHL